MKILLIPTTIITVFIIAAAVLIMQSQHYFSTSINQTKEVSQMVEQISQEPKEAKVSLNSSNQITISLNQPEVLSAMAVRINIPIKNDSQAPELSISTELVSANWNYPISKVYIKDEYYVIDLAAINISTDGYQASDNLVVASLDLDSNISLDQISFEKKQTKVIRKNGTELNVYYE